MKYRADQIIYEENLCLPWFSILFRNRLIIFGLMILSLDNAFLMMVSFPGSPASEKQCFLYLWILTLGIIIIAIGLFQVINQYLDVKKGNKVVCPRCNKVSDYKKNKLNLCEKCGKKFINAEKR